MVAANVHSASLEELIEPAFTAALRSGEEKIAQVQQRNPAPVLLPRHNELRSYVTGAMSALEPNILVETLYLYKKGEGANGWSEAERTGLYNQLLALSTLTGIQYYSASRNAMRTFYESSQAIDGPDTKRAVGDPVYPQPPPALTLYARQKDLTFGENIYSFDYRITADCIFFAQENLTALSYGIIRAVGRNNLRTILAVVDAGDSLLVYAASMARASSVFGMGDRIGASFGNRAEAVFKWFSARADRVFN